MWDCPVVCHPISTLQIGARKFLVGGNFKMNGDLNTLTTLLTQFNEAKLDPNVEVIIAPPALYLIPLKEHARKEIAIAAQNAHQLGSGAYTGEISQLSSLRIKQIKDVGLKWVILGHSERRSLFHESDELVAEKTAAAIKEGISVVLCCGESLEERKAEKTVEVNIRQLRAVAKVLSKDDWKHVVIAYEPIWAIGTGLVATPQQAQDVHKEIRAWLSKEISPEVGAETRIIYGGSVNEKNAKELAACPDIDGFLVGGASLKPTFVQIINCKTEGGKL
ncbi:BQ5605_C003g02550 [Microbotryum silenes-dioicae]|uniref:Triosephosphate isomerase n=1 Tax=Microbotryum silenes-dioicae TaxID=796604 RepID=A0A2X0P4J1_9BASI|nr:BQ5605_C003g02550 [Microbotryum silenes-dioicae]